MKITKAITLPSEFQSLIESANNEGHSFVLKTKIEWDSGKNAFSKTGEIFYLAYQNNKIVGCCGLNVDPYSCGPIGRIRHLYVLPEYRRNKIGKELVMECIKFGKKYFKQIRLRANDLNKESYIFYDSIGFQRTNHDNFETHRIELKY